MDFFRRFSILDDLLFGSNYNLISREKVKDNEVSKLYEDGICIYFDNFYKDMINTEIDIINPTLQNNRHSILVIHS